MTFRTIFIFYFLFLSIHIICQNKSLVVYFDDPTYFKPYFENSILDLSPSKQNIFSDIIFLNDIFSDNKTILQVKSAYGIKSQDQYWGLYNFDKIDVDTTTIQKLLSVNYFLSIKSLKLNNDNIEFQLELVNKENSSGKFKKIKSISRVVNVDDKDINGQIVNIIKSIFPETNSKPILKIIPLENPLYIDSTYYINITNTLKFELNESFDNENSFDQLEFITSSVNKSSIIEIIKSGSQFEIIPKGSGIDQVSVSCCDRSGKCETKYVKISVKNVSPIKLGYQKGLDISIYTVKNLFSKDTFYFGSLPRMARLANKSFKNLCDRNEIIPDTLNFYTNFFYEDNKLSKLYLSKKNLDFKAWRFLRKIDAFYSPFQTAYLYMYDSTFISDRIPIKYKKITSLKPFSYGLYHSRGLTPEYRDSIYDFFFIHTAIGLNIVSHLHRNINLLAGFSILNLFKTPGDDPGENYNCNCTFRAYGTINAGFEVNLLENLIYFIGKYSIYNEYYKYKHGIGFNIPYKKYSLLINGGLFKPNHNNSDLVKYLNNDRTGGYFDFEIRIRLD